MAWVYLLIAGLCEVIWAAGLKRFGFTVASLGGCATLAVMALSFICLAQAMRVLPIGVSYSVWVGIGAAGTAIYGVVALGESADLRKWLCVALIIAGVVGLSVAAPDTQPRPVLTESR